MAPPVTPRNKRGDARIDLHTQKDDLQAVVDIVKEIDASWDAWYHHAMRRLAAANHKRREAIRSLADAQASEDMLLESSVERACRLPEAGAAPAGLAI